MKGGKSMETHIIPREEKADLLFEKILKDPEAVQTADGDFL